MKLLPMTIIFLFCLPMVALYAIEKDEQSASKRVASDEKLPDTPDIPKIDYPELPENVPNVKNLIDLSNQVIELFNQDQLQTVSHSISEKWKENVIKKQEYQRNDGIPDHEIKLRAGAKLTYRYNDKTKKQELNSILILSARVPTNEAGKSVSSKLLWVILAICFKDNKIDFIFSDLFGNSDDFFACMNFSDEGIKFSSLSFDKDRLMPWVKWDKDGKIQEQGSEISRQDAGRILEQRLLGEWTTESF